MKLATKSRPTKMSLACLFAFLALALPTNALAASNAISEFPLSAGSSPEGIATGRDGNLWFTDLGSNAITRITPTGEVTEFPLPTPQSRPAGIAAAADGNLWFTEEATGRIGRITPAGLITEFAISECGSCRPTGIAAGPDGNVWFTLTDMFGAVGRVTPQGEITLIHGVGGSPRGIAAGPDGNLWVAVTGYVREEPNFGQIARITPSGAVTLFAIPARFGRVIPAAVTPGSDGNIWFAGGDRIGRIDTFGRVTMLDVPVPGEVNAVTNGVDGNLWFGSSGVAPKWGAIGRVTPDGHATLFPVAYGSRGVAAGPDGNIWFTEWARRRIGRISPTTSGLGIESSKARVPNRATRIALSCSGAGLGHCRGILDFVIRKRERPSVYEIVRVGRASYDLVPGQERSVKVRLTRRGLALLDRRPVFRVRAVAKSSAGQGMTRPILLRR